MSGRLYVVWAPSGGGKSSLVNALTARDALARRSVSHTTRPIRDGEVDGRDYHFVDRARFMEMALAGDFLEHAEVYGNLYGTSEKWIRETLAADQDVFLTIDWQGAQQVRQRFPDVVLIYILPPSLAALRERLEGRGQDGPEVLARRLAAAREDLSHLIEFHYVIINDQFDVALNDLASIVRAERLKCPRQTERHMPLIQNLMKD